MRRVMIVFYDGNDTHVEDFTEQHIGHLSERVADIQSGPKPEEGIERIGGDVMAIIEVLPGVDYDKSNYKQSFDYGSPSPLMMLLETSTGASMA